MGQINCRYAEDGGSENPILNDRDTRRKKKRAKGKTPQGKKSRRKHRKKASSSKPDPNAITEDTDEESDIEEGKKRETPQKDKIVKVDLDEDDQKAHEGSELDEPMEPISSEFSDIVKVGSEGGRGQGGLQILKDLDQPADVSGVVTDDSAFSNKPGRDCCESCILRLPKCFALYYLLVIILMLGLGIYCILTLYMTTRFDYNVMFFLMGESHRDDWKMICIASLSAFVVLVLALNMYVASQEEMPRWMCALFCCYPFTWFGFGSIKRPIGDLASIEWVFWGVFMFIGIGAVWFIGDGIWAFSKLFNDDHSDDVEFIIFISQLVWWGCGGVVLCTYLFAYPFRQCMCPAKPEEDSDLEAAVELTAKPQGL